MKKAFFVATILSSLIAVGAFAAEKTTTKTEKKTTTSTSEMTPEMRQNMAKMHEDMATCLRSDKAVGECRKEMMKTCQGMGEHGCPMMSGMGHMEHGKKHQEGGSQSKMEHSS